MSKPGHNSSFGGNDTAITNLNNAPIFARPPPMGPKAMSRSHRDGFNVPTEASIPGLRTAIWETRNRLRDLRENLDGLSPSALRAEKDRCYRRIRLDEVKLRELEGEARVRKLEEEARLKKLEEEKARLKDLEEKGGAASPQLPTTGVLASSHRRRARRSRFQAVTIRAFKSVAVASSLLEVPRMVGASRSRTYYWVKYSLTKARK
ncbi:hypothetical protein QBC41DRAFT_340368 [Cercophora samala]|uniref:Uncharacterized protein n=1 Tax=Cercophora samala TaxID=330535 RepID=A0AA40D5V5_9PEZI|nr:hypothetical protein QBC41DRAFT_340368 [Cercophora samala]